MPHWPRQGAVVERDGTRFTVFSAHAQTVELALFERHGAPPSGRIPMEPIGRHLWTVFVPGAGPGTLYGFLAHGVWEPWRGDRYNENKLLLDPYGLAVTGIPKQPAPENYGHRYESGDDLVKDCRPHLDLAAKSVVVDPLFDWGEERRPEVAPGARVIYELHVRGFTAHHSSGSRHPGSYLGVLDRVEHLLDLGVTTVELLPVQAAAPDGWLEQKGLSNYWGYNSIAFFAPDPRYAVSTHPGAAVVEFKEMVRGLHAAGIEVILDVVYNHSAEGNHLGPTYSFRGLDNRSYYRLEEAEKGGPRLYQNLSGCGNTFDCTSPQMVALIMDSLRYWAAEMHVDGFRFDLATILGSTRDGFSERAPLLCALAQDPELNGLSLIAEPWDITQYGAGRFPEQWYEWNGRYRDTVRRFWRGEPGMAAQLATSLAGSRDLFGNGRVPGASINMVTCHDGFTLRDLVSYTYKRNEGNLEDNRDGAQENYSQNCGEEGETATCPTLARRMVMARNLMATLMLSAGTPMIRGGDELLQSQRGNNNAYCQDNELSWLDWTVNRDASVMAAFVARLNSWIARRPWLRESGFFGPEHGTDSAIVQWFAPDGEELRWDDTGNRALCLMLHDARQPQDRVCLCLNAGAATTLLLPGQKGCWSLVLDTARYGAESNSPDGIGESYAVAPGSLVLLEWSPTTPPSA